MESAKFVFGENGIYRPGGPQLNFCEKNKSTQKLLKMIWIDPVFCANFKYVIHLDQKSH